MAYCDNPMCRDPDCRWWQPHGYDTRQGKYKIGSSDYSSCLQEQKRRDSEGLTPYQRYLRDLATGSIELANALLNEIEDKKTKSPIEKSQDKTPS